MPIHDWMRVNAGIFHDFHHGWVSTIRGALNHALPPNYYPLIEKTFEVTEVGRYETLANSVVVHDQNDHRVIAMVVIVSPGNKNDKTRLGRFITKIDDLLSLGIHLLIVDLIPSGTYDPKGIHGLVWEEYDFKADRPLTTVSYVGSPDRQAYLEPLRVGEKLPKMPVFLSTDRFVSLELEATYEAAWNQVSSFWRNVVVGK